MLQFYRKTILILITTHLIYTFLPYLGPYIYSEQTNTFLGFSGVESIISLSEIQKVIISFLYLLFSVGLYFFSPIARIGFTIIVLFNMTIGSFYFGYSASAYLETSIGYLLSLLEGATLVMIYVTSVAPKFNRVEKKALNSEVGC